MAPQLEAIGWACAPLPEPLATGEHEIDRPRRGALRSDGRSVPSPRARLTSRHSNGPAARRPTSVSASLSGAASSAAADAPAACAAPRRSARWLWTRAHGIRGNAFHVPPPCNHSAIDDRDAARFARLVDRMCMPAHLDVIVKPAPVQGIRNVHVRQRQRRTGHRGERRRPQRPGAFTEQEPVGADALQFALLGRAECVGGGQQVLASGSVTGASCSDCTNSESRPIATWIGSARQIVFEVSLRPLSSAQA